MFINKGIQNDTNGYLNYGYINIKWIRSFAVYQIVKDSLKHNKAEFFKYKN